MRHLLLLILAWGIAGASIAQTTIRGKVYEEVAQPVGKPQHLPLPGAYVSIAGKPIGTSTDLHGFFKLAEIEIGDTLVASMVGYSGVGVVVTDKDFIELALSPGVELAAAEVEARAAAASFSLLDPLNVQTINRAELVKAACCNLSEAFETNASVDASFTDAVTGTRQIRMLGLDGKYTQIEVDNLPGPRGLNTVTGLAFIPGDWVDAISISKGAGSVMGGHESMTGLINVAMKNPMNADPLHVNLYGNASGRMEWNHISTHQVSRKWKTALLSHALWNSQLNDRNSDGFLDTPVQRHAIARSEWKYTGDRNLRGEYALNWVRTQVAGGQVEGFGGQTNWTTISDWLITPQAEAWTALTDVERVEVTAKTGYVFPDAEWRSIGSQFSWVNHQQNQQYGARHYQGLERHFRGKLLYSSIFGSTNHKYTAGLMLDWDDFDEAADIQPDSTRYFARTEQVPGAFFEYTLNHKERLHVVAGLRFDQHNLYGAFWTPRLHARWSATDQISLKLAAGRGWRTPNVFAEQLGSWASQRTWRVESGPQGFKPEIATNLGFNLTSKFRLNHRDGDLALDFHHTAFDNRLVVDLENPAEVWVYNLAGSSSATSAQIEFNWSAHRRLDVRLAYRYVDARTDRQSTEETWDPFVPRHRAFSQWSWAGRVGERGEQWRTDATLQWIGEQRLPSTASLPESLVRPDVAPDYVQLNVQVSRDFSKQLGLYLGVENLLNTRQAAPIVAASAPQDLFDAHFDASLVYGPIFGRMVYGGLRWRILPPEDTAH